MRAVMAEILAFPAESGRREPDLDGSRATSEPALPAGPAEIVIFPGVRIERHSFSLADRLPRQLPAGDDGNPRRGRG